MGDPFEQVELEASVFDAEHSKKMVSIAAGRHGAAIDETQALGDRVPEPLQAAARCPPWLREPLLELIRFQLADQPSWHRRSRFSPRTIAAGAQARALRQLVDPVELGRVEESLEAVERARLKSEKNPGSRRSPPLVHEQVGCGLLGGGSSNAPTCASRQQVA